MHQILLRAVQLMITDLKELRHRSCTLKKN